jgi:cytidine deaminase
MIVSDLRSAAAAAQANAYAPYSGFRVGAALETGSGAVIVGCNVENGSYGMTLCAERNALAAAVAQGHQDFKRLGLVSDAPTPISPCGACRQVLAEFAPDMVVESWGAEGGTEQWTVRELLPAAFERPTK